MKGIEFHVVKHRGLYVGLAVALMVASALLLAFKGFNLGIDFESGFSVSVHIGSGDATIENVRASLSSVDGVRVQNIGSMEDGRFQIRAKLGAQDDRRSMENHVKALLAKAFADVTVLGSSFIGAKFSSSLITGSVKAVAIALALILVYVWVRFKVAYAIGSIAALCHDVLLMLGFISLIGFEISSTTIAALLTIIGYSLNNTIVIFDRVRESVRGDNTQNPEAVMDKGVNGSLTRTTYSSVTTLLAVLPLAVLSSGDVRSFSICMIFGVAVGTYSSNFIATNILYALSRIPAMDILKVEEEEDLSDVETAKRMLNEEPDPWTVSSAVKQGRSIRKSDDDDPKILV